MAKSLHDVKDKKSKKNSNTITDADYFFRDKEEEAKRGYPNTVDITPEEYKKTNKRNTSSNKGA